MLNIQTMPVTELAASRIRKWLGAEGASDFMDYLATEEAILTAEAGNLLLEAQESPSRADEARAKANEAAEIRRLIERINSARNQDFQFRRCEITPTPNATIRP